jgi:hypothetical protein
VGGVEGGAVSEPIWVDLSTLMQYGDWVMPKCSIPPTEVPTPDKPGTATAYCASHNSQFPLTPCPTINP